MRNTQNKKNNKILKTIIISTVLAIICELISSFIINKTNNIQIYKIIIESAIIIFIGLHFTVGIKKLYNFLIENRYKLSVILIIVSTVMGFLENSMELKEWLVTKDVSLCLWWNIKFYSLLLATYELFLIITNNKNISIIGTIVIAFSGTVQWNFNYIDALIIGEIITVLINKLLETSKVKKQILLPITISIAIICYTYTQTSFAISFGYVFIALIIWIFIKNKEYLKKTNF